MPRPARSDAVAAASTRVVEDGELDRAERGESRIVARGGEVAERGRRPAPAAGHVGVGRRFEREGRRGPPATDAAGSMPPRSTPLGAAPCPRPGRLGPAPVKPRSTTSSGCRHWAGTEPSSWNHTVARGRGHASPTATGRYSCLRASPERHRLARRRGPRRERPGGRARAVQRGGEPLANETGDAGEDEAGGDTGPISALNRSAGPPPAARRARRPSSGDLLAGGARRRRLPPLGRGGPDLVVQPRRGAGSARGSGRRSSCGTRAGDRGAGR